MSKKKRQFNPELEKNEGINAVRNQLIESYQSGVVEDELENNRGIHDFNNRKN